MTFPRFGGSGEEPQVQCAACGREEAAFDVAWTEVQIHAGTSTTTLWVCTTCQRTAHLTETALVTMVARYIRERLRFRVADAMMEVRS